MLKKLSFIALVALVAASCSIKEPRMECLVPVNVHLSGFSVSEEDFPSTKTTADPATYDGVNALTLAFYSGSTEVEKIT